MGSGEKTLGVNRLTYKSFTKMYRGLQDKYFDRHIRSNYPQRARVIEIRPTEGRLRERGDRLTNNGLKYALPTGTGLSCKGERCLL